MSSKEAEVLDRHKQPVSTPQLLGPWVCSIVVVGGSGRIGWVTESLKPGSFSSWTLSVDDCKLDFPKCTTLFFLFASGVFSSWNELMPTQCEPTWEKCFTSRCIPRSPSKMFSEAPALESSWPPMYVDLYFVYLCPLSSHIEHTGFLLLICSCILSCS